jgi:hypothetical protein
MADGFGTAAVPSRSGDRRRGCPAVIGEVNREGIAGHEGGSMGWAGEKVAMVAGGAPIRSPSSHPALTNTESQEAGLWLWRGEALPPPSAPPPKSRIEPESRVQQILGSMVPAARWAGWMALLGGLAVALLAASAMLHPTPPEESVSVDTPAVSLSPVPSATVVPPSVAPAPADLTEAQSDQTEVPPAAQTLARPAETRVAKSRAQPPRTVRKTQASPVRRVTPTLIPGVLTPPSMTWRGGGY